MNEVRLTQLLMVYREKLTALVDRRPSDYPWIREQGMDAYISTLRARVVVEGAAAINLDSPAWRKTLIALQIHRSQRAFNEWLGLDLPKPGPPRGVPY